MIKVYQCANSIELATFKDVMARNDINIFVKNEFIAGAIGELPFTEAWPEIWVLDHQDEDKAKQLCQQTEQEIQAPQQDWLCNNCGETNNSSFEYCWQCEQLAVNS
jgi:hypothetical protein